MYAIVDAGTEPVSSFLANAAKSVSVKWRSVANDPSGAGWPIVVASVVVSCPSGAPTSTRYFAACPGVVAAAATRSRNGSGLSPCGFWVAATAAAAAAVSQVPPVWADSAMANTTSVVANWNIGSSSHAPLPVAGAVPGCCGGDAERYATAFDTVVGSAAPAVSAGMQSAAVIVTMHARAR